MDHPPEDHSGSQAGGRAGADRTRTRGKERLGDRDSNPDKQIQSLRSYH